MLSIILQKSLHCSDPGSDKLRFPILAVHRALLLMNDCSSGWRIYGQLPGHRFIRTEAYCSAARFHSEQNNCKFLINILCLWTKCESRATICRIHRPDGYILKSNIAHSAFVCAGSQFTDRFPDQTSIHLIESSLRELICPNHLLWNSIIRVCPQFCIIPIIILLPSGASTVCIHNRSMHESAAWCFRNKGLGFLIKFTDKAKFPSRA